MHRPISLAIQEGGGSPQSVVLASPAATYKPFGPLASLRLDLTTDRNEVREYDLRYAPTSIRLQATSGNPPTQLFAWNYTTDAVGNVTGIDQTQPSSATREYGYQDWQYFLACAAGPWNAGSPSCEPVDGALEWMYDRTGNRLYDHRTGAQYYNYAQNAAASGNTSLLEQIAPALSSYHLDYAFDAGGYLSQLEEINDPTTLRTIDYTFDAAGQLTFVDTSGNRDAAMDYDGRSFLRELTWGSFSLEPVYSSDGVLHSLLRTPGGVQPTERINVLYFAGRPIGIWKKVGTSSATLTRLVTDHLGTPAASIQQAGSAVDWYGGFEPFGEDWQAGTGQDSLAKGIFLRMPGQWKDPIWSTATYPMELFYNVHRWYETGTGRYASTDPLGSGGDPNPFTYARSHPLFWIDPLGWYSYCNGRWRVWRYWMLGDRPSVELPAIPIVARPSSRPPRVPGGMTRPPGHRPGKGFGIIPPGKCFCSWNCVPCEGGSIFDPRKLPQTTGRTIFSGYGDPAGDTCLCGAPGHESGCPDQICEASPIDWTGFPFFYEPEIEIPESMLIQLRNRFTR